MAWQILWENEVAFEEKNWSAQQYLLSKLFTTHYYHVPRDVEDFEKELNHFEIGTTHLYVAGFPGRPIDLLCDLLALSTTCWWQSNNKYMI